MTNNVFSISQITTYKTILKNSEAEFKDRGSRFIAYVFSIKTIEEIKKEIKLLKELHPKAVHYCYAYKLGLDDNNFRTVDDGEPSGSAGKPILGQIQSAQITNVLIVVVRYFGGTLLGVPGLINAYKTAAQLALQQNEIIEKNVEVNYLIKFDYTIMNDIMRVLKLHDCNIISQEMTLFCDLKFSVTLENESVVVSKLEKLRNVEIHKLLSK